MPSSTTIRAYRSNHHDYLSYHYFYISSFCNKSSSSINLVWLSNCLHVVLIFVVVVVIVLVAVAVAVAVADVVVDISPNQSKWSSSLARSRIRRAGRLCVMPGVSQRRYWVNSEKSKFDAYDFCVISLRSFRVASSKHALQKRSSYQQQQLHHQQQQVPLSLCRTPDAAVEEMS